MSVTPSSKSILMLSLIATFGILAGFAIFIIWFEFANLTLLISAALFFVGLGCVYILYRGFKRKQIRFAFAQALIIILAVSSIFMYSSLYDLRNRVTALEAPQLNEVDWKYNYGEFIQNHFPYMNVTIKGTVFNSGTYSVNVTLVFQVRGEKLENYTVTDGGIILTREIPFGTIAGKSYETFDTDLIYFAGTSGGHITHSYSFI